MLWLIGLVIVFAIWVLLNLDAHPMDNMPGPPKIPIFGNSRIFLWKNQRQLLETLNGLPKLYGNRFVMKLFKRRILHVSNVKDIEVILSHTRNINKNKAYTFFEPWLGTGLLTSTESKWHKRRKILTPAFHFNILKNFTAVFQRQSKSLVEQLKKETDFVDVLPLVTASTLFIICETAMGTQMDGDKSPTTLQYKKAISMIGNILITRLTNFLLHSELVFNMLPIGRHFRKYRNDLCSFADNVILERKKEVIDNVRQENEENDGKKRLALLDLLLEVENKGEIDLEGIREEVNTFMFGGHDTTAVALTFALMLLADHEKVQERIYEECKSVSDMTKLKYLEAVIKEVLRLYPPVGYIARQISEDFTLDGDVLVPKGSEVMIHIYDMHRSPDVYPEPEAFLPERFLNGEIRSPFAFVPFSAGPRNCIGQRFAMQEMKCMLSEICRNFRMEPRTKGWRSPLMTDLVLRPVEPIYIKFIPR